MDNNSSVLILQADKTNMFLSSTVFAILISTIIACCFSTLLVLVFYCYIEEQVKTLVRKETKLMWNALRRLAMQSMLESNNNEDVDRVIVWNPNSDLDISYDTI